MTNQNKFNKIFPIKKPIIGMIHLAGENKVKRVLEELAIFEQEGIDGAIIEDYHGSYEDVYETLKQTSKLDLKLTLGVNVLIDPYSSFELAKEFGAKFIQFDSVQTTDLNSKRYSQLRENYPNIVVLGGIGFKYVPPTGNPLEVDLEQGKSRCEAIVTTGTGTGIETPIKKLKQYKTILKDFPLIVGAGVNINNICEQLSIANGAIIGSSLKPKNNTYLPINRNKVKDLMDLVKKIRLK